MSDEPKIAHRSSYDGRPFLSHRQWRDYVDAGVMDGDPDKVIFTHNIPRTTALSDRIWVTEGLDSRPRHQVTGDLNVQERHDGAIRRGLAGCLSAAVRLLPFRRGDGPPVPQPRLSEGAIAHLLGDHSAIHPTYRIRTSQITNHHYAKSDHERH